MKNTLIVIIACLVQGGLFAQNMVSNGSFEKTIKLPLTHTETNFEFTNTMENWRTPNRATPDLISPKFQSEELLSGRAKSGYNMVGMAIGSPEWEECIGTPLQTALEAGKEYWVEFWIKRPAYNGWYRYTEEENIKQTSFGALFTKTAVGINNSKQIEYTAQLSCQNDFMLSKEWAKLGFKYTPAEAFQYLYIGNFKPKDATQRALMGYLLVDDILIEPYDGQDELAPEEALAALDNPTELEAGTIIALDNIYFNTGTADLSTSSHTELQKIIDALTTQAQLVIKINGHTDSVGQEESNKRLSEQRAKAVYDYLLATGVDKEQLQWEGFGESTPIADNKTKEGRQQNRRVELEVVSK